MQRPTSVLAWLQLLHQQTQQRTYSGTVVLSSVDGAMSSARVWHVCEGDVHMERVESLTGTPRVSIRKGDDVMTFLPQSKVVVNEKRPSLSLFAAGSSTLPESLDGYYRLWSRGGDRIAGFDADVTQIISRDPLRYGYRVWTEKQTGLVVKTQTMDILGRVLEQVVFSELRMDAPVPLSRLERMMHDTRGWRVVSATTSDTTAQSEGWALAHEVPGFSPAGCFRRVESNGAEETSAVQWTFTDGLARVSLFIEPWNPQRHNMPIMQSMGATHALGMRLMGNASAWWVTAVGEVPMMTLEMFARELVRTP